MTGPDLQGHPIHRLLTDLMRALLRGDIDSARAIFVSRDFSLEKALGLLKKNGLAGYFYVLCGHTGLADLIPAAQMEELAARYEAQDERNRHNVVLLSEVKGKLDDAAIPFLSLKGLYLAERFFGGVDRRFMWDLDILVHPEDFERAITAVAEIGLLPSSEARFDPTNSLWGIHAVQVRGTIHGNPGYVDIHHAIRSLPRVQFDHDALWRNSIEFQLGDSGFPTLCDIDTLLISAIGLGTDIQTSHHNLRKIWDVYIMLNDLDSTVDWTLFFARCERQGCLKLVLNVFAFVLLLLEAKPDCPRIGRAMACTDPGLLCISNEKQADRVFARNRQNIFNRILFSRLLPVSPLHYWLDWMFTLPVRMWHYRRG